MKRVFNAARHPRGCRPRAGRATLRRAVPVPFLKNESTLRRGVFPEEGGALCAEVSLMHGGSLSAQRCLSCTEVYIGRLYGMLGT